MCSLKKTVIYITSEMQSIRRAKLTVLMVTPWPLTDCVHWHKTKINVSLYRKLLSLQLMWLKVQSFITLFISIGCVNYLLFAAPG